MLSYFNLFVFCPNSKCISRISLLRIFSYFFTLKIHLGEFKDTCMFLVTLKICVINFLRIAHFHTCMFNIIIICPLWRRQYLDNPFPNRKKTGNCTIFKSGFFSSRLSRNFLKIQIYQITDYF